MTPDQISAQNTQQQGFLRFCKQAVATVSALVVILLAAIVSAPLLTDIVYFLNSEPVHEVQPEYVNPAYEGKLVKMRVHELRAEGGSVADKQFGISRENTIALCRYYQTDTHGRINVVYNALDGVPKACFQAPVVRAGAYKVKARDDFWEDLPHHDIHGDEIKLPAEWESRLVERRRDGVILRTLDMSNLAVPEVKLCISQVSSPWAGTRYVVGRQQGDTLDLTGKDCGLIRGEKQFQVRTRSYSLFPPETSVGEHILWQGVLLFTISLGLIPAMMMLQKRGWVRAAIMSLGGALALVSLFGTGWILLIKLLHPSQTVEATIWISEAIPGLLATVLLCLANRQNHQQRRNKS